jgi:hypothetical protein
LQNSLAILEISTRFLLEFLNFHKVKTNGLNNVFQRALKEVLKDEDSVLRSIQMKQGNMNIAQEIVNFINRGEIKLTYSIFEGEAYVKKDILYIQPACILRELNKNISNGGLSVNALSTYLGKNNLLKLDKSGDYTQKGDNKKRYYLIKLDVLQEIANTELVINSI